MTHLIQPSTLRSSSPHVTVQFIELTDTHLLIRLRRAVAQTDRTVERERFALAIGAGEPVVMTMLVAMGDGPFAGIMDVAFPRPEELDLEGGLVLASDNYRIEFRL